MAYPPRRVNNIYLDSAHLSSLTDNLAGLSERRKLRLRWYGDITGMIRPILELKQKINLLGTKYQTLLPNALDLTLDWTDILAGVRASVTPWWRVVLTQATQPALINRYWREYYTTPDGEIRVTIDSRLTAYDQRLTIRPNLHKPLPISDQVVVEIKASENQAERVAHVANEFPIPRSRNSKYCAGLQSAPG